MATITSTSWLPGWPAIRLGRHEVRARTAAVEVDVPLARGERVLTVVRGVDSSSVVATERAVYHRSPAGPSVWLRLGWEQVGRADWDEQHGLVLTGWTPDAPARTVLALPHRETLLALVRERVAWTTLIVTRIPVGGRCEARVAARRQPGTDRLLWMVALNPVGSDTAPARAEVDAALARLRANLGL